MRTVKRILKINEIDNYKVYCLFNNGESRIIDFKQLFTDWDIKKSDHEWPLTQSIKEFAKVELIEGALTWKNIEIESQNEFGDPVIYPYDIDPIVLYDNSNEDQSREIQLGQMIKQSGNEMGLTQEELARRSGTTKHYISRIENNRTGIEISTLKRIIEGGLGKKMKITIR